MKTAAVSTARVPRGHLKRQAKAWPCATLAALLLPACAGTPSPTLVTVTPEMPPPVLAAECWRPSPAAPRLAGGTARQIAWHLETSRKDRAKLVAWRAVCRASLKASFGEPGAGAPQKADRPSS